MTALAFSPSGSNTYLTLCFDGSCQTFASLLHLQRPLLYHEETDNPVLCRALNINEDLGQIKYVFSDKTGTLTENKMVFKRCTIGGRNFSHGDVWDGFGKLAKYKPIRWSLYLSYKPLESNLSRVDL